MSATTAAVPSNSEGEFQPLLIGFFARMIFLNGLPPKITYPELCKYVKGGPIDTIRIFEKDHSAFVIFLRAKDKEAYEKFLETNEVKIRGSKLMQMPWDQKYLNNLRLLQPDEIFQRGWTRCIFLQGIPAGTSLEMLRRDLMSIIGIKLDFQKIEVRGVCAKVWNTDVTTALALRDGLMKHNKYSGIYISFEKDPCDAPPSTITINP
jgi:hypothetical protein